MKINNIFLAISIYCFAVIPPTAIAVGLLLITIDFYYMKVIDRITSLIVTVVLIGFLVILFSTVENTNNQYKSLIPDQILVVSDGYVIDSNYIYLTQQDSIIFKVKKNEELSVYLCTIFPERYLRSTR